MQKKWNTRWITPKAKPFKSTIAGYGLSVLERIHKGEIVCVFGGIIVPKNEINEYNDAVSQLGIQVNEGFFICPLESEESKKVGVFNHSCDPNCGFMGAVTAIAIKNVEIGEELTLDYAFMDSARYNFKCKCGSKNCREKITINDWKLKQLQDKYFEYFSPYLKEKIQVQNNTSL